MSEGRDKNWFDIYDECSTKQRREILLMLVKKRLSPARPPLDRRAYLHIAIVVTVIEALLMALFPSPVPLTFMEILLIWLSAFFAVAAIVNPPPLFPRRPRAHWVGDTTPNRRLP